MCNLKNVPGPGGAPLCGWAVLLGLLLAPLLAYGQSAPTASGRGLSTVYSPEQVENRALTFRDTRLLTWRHTDKVYRMPRYSSRAAWTDRARALREHILTAAGLWPLPDRTPLNAHVLDRVEGDGYVVEKVYFESYPDFIVAGNLYRPRGEEGPFPGILSPHGHWPHGRTHDTERASVPARGANLARQGHVVLTYDMVGFGDTRQVNHQFAADSLSQLWGTSLLGLQLWNSMRALDYLRSRPEVDTGRIGVTGASGGVTQQFLLTAVDTAGHVDVTAPVNMISAYMQGGDLCENAPGLRLHTNNVEIGALAAPRPQLMISNTHDWTSHTPVVEYPMMRSIYRLYDAPHRVENAHFDFPHNYNAAAREAVYAWMGDQLLQSPAASYEDRPVDLAPQDLLLFLNERVGDPALSFDDLAPGQYDPPPTDLDAAALKADLKQRATDQVRARWPSAPTELERFDEAYGTAARHLLAAAVPDSVQVRRGETTSLADATVTDLLVSRAGRRDWIPALWIEPPEADGAVTLAVSPNGKAALTDSTDERLVPWVRRLLAEGQRVLAIDPFQVGEHVLPPGTETPRDESDPFFTTFNRTDTQERVQDLLTALRYLRRHAEEAPVHLVGLEEAGAWALLAGTRAGDLVDQTVAYRLPPDTGTPNAALRDSFVPGLARIGGLRTAAALQAPTPVTLHLTGDQFDTDPVAQVYTLHDAASRFEVVRGPRSPEQMVDWLRE